MPRSWRPLPGEPKSLPPPHPFTLLTITPQIFPISYPVTLLTITPKSPQFFAVLESTGNLNVWKQISTRTFGIGALTCYLYLYLFALCSKNVTFSVQLLQQLKWNKTGKYSRSLCLSKFATLIIIKSKLSRFFCRIRISWLLGFWPVSGPART